MFSGAAAGSLQRVCMLESVDKDEVPVALASDFSGAAHNIDSQVVSFSVRHTPVKSISDAEAMGFWQIACSISM